MEVNGKAGKMSGEVGMTDKQNMQEDIVINVSSGEKEPNPYAFKDQRVKLTADSPQRLSSDLTSSPQKAARVSFPSPEIARFSPSPNRPPKIPTNDTLTRRKTLAKTKTFSRSVYSKPKSRFGEQSAVLDSKMFEESDMEEHEMSGCVTPNAKVDIDSAGIKDGNRAVPVTPKTPLMSSPAAFGGMDEHEEIYKKVSSRKKLKYRKFKVKALIEWFLFLCLLGWLIASLIVNKLQNVTFWGLEIWKWSVLVLVTFSGLFVTDWLMRFIVLLIELNYLLKKKVLYFVHGLKKSVRVCIWLGLVLITWVLLFREGVKVKRSHFSNRILDFITWTIATLLIGAQLWLVKTLLLKMLASSFHVNTFFDRIQESIFHQYILFSLSGAPIMESAHMLGKANSNASQFSFRVGKKVKEGKEKNEKKEKNVIDMNKLHQMKQGKVSAWTMKMLVDGISNSGLTTLSSAIDESAYDGGNEQVDKEITNEEEAIAAAYHIFRNVAQPGCKYIDEFDMRRFMIKEEVDFVFPMIDVAETGQIVRKTLTDFVVKVYKDRKALAHALNDTKTAVKQLNKVVSAILSIAIIVVWLLLTGIANTKVLLFLSSQLVVAAFIFGNTCKTIFEAIIFVFVMHPFDVGDRCVIDGVQMIVEEMNILNTVFLRFDNEKIYYPNSVLSTKPISNFYRSPDMGDSLEFSIDFRTPLEKIGSLKEKFKKYLENNPQYWHPNHSVVVKEIENVNKLKMAVFFNHTMNFQNFRERNLRRTELVLEMKKIFEDLNIRYDLLPQEVRLIESKTVAPGTGR